RRVYTYPAYSIVAELNLLATIGAVLQAAGILLFIGNVWWALARGPRAGSNPWDGYTLEWSVPSPPPPENFAEIPRVRGHRPLWEEREARGGRRNTGDAR
ncbi:MAG TPA: cytochrome ubiquinol oxidase subunit I, partial [Chloroflexota bacterium]